MFHFDIHVMNIEKGERGVQTSNAIFMWHLFWVHHRSQRTTQHIKTDGTEKLMSQFEM